jgi:cell shape-determining protein MreD
MTRIIFRFLNGPALVLLTLLGIAIQSSFFTFWLLPYIQPDLILLVVLWCALRREFLEGGVLTLILANCAEIHSGCPRGLYLISYMLIYLLVRLAARLLVIPDIRSNGSAVFISSVAAKLFSLGIVYLLGISTGQWNHTLLFVIPGALMNGLIGHRIFAWLEKFDQITFRNAQVESSTEDELEMEISEI